MRVSPRALPLEEEGPRAAVCSSASRWAAAGETRPVPGETSAQVPTRRFCCQSGSSLLEVLLWELPTTLGFNLCSPGGPRGLESTGEEPARQGPLRQSRHKAPREVSHERLSWSLPGALSCAVRSADFVSPWRARLFLEPCQGQQKQDLSVF